MNVLEQMCFEDGQEAYEQRKPISACPYKGKSIKAAWEAGWRSGEDATLDGFLPQDGMTD